MKTERAGLILVNLLLIAAFCILTQSCMTYQKAVRKFGHMATDSSHIIVRDTVLIPKDSIVFGTRTDTTVIHEVFQQGRARLTFDRNPKNTNVKAECLPDTIKIEIPGNCPPVATFGIAPWYRWAFFIALGALIIAVIMWILTYKLKLSLAKRENN